MAGRKKTETGGKKTKSTAKEKRTKGKSILGKHPLNVSSAVVENYSEQNNVTFTQQQSVSGRIRNAKAMKRCHEKKEAVEEAKRSEYCVNRSNEEHDYDSRSEVQAMVNVIKKCLTLHGLSQSRTKKQVNGHTKHEWQNQALKVDFTIQPNTLSLLSSSSNTTNSGVSSQSNSTEEENDSSSSYVTSDCDSLDDYLHVNFDGFDSGFNGMSDMHIDHIKPNKIEKQDVNLCVLVTINGIWDSDLIVSHAVLENFDLKSGTIIETKLIETLHASASSGTTTHIAINLKEFSIGKYKLKLVANDEFSSQVGESNSVDFEIVGGGYTLGNNDFGNDSNTCNNNNTNENGAGYSYSGSNLSVRHKNICPDLLLDVDIENGKSTSVYTFAASSFKKVFKQFAKFDNSAALALLILPICVFIPNASRSVTLATDPMIRGCYYIIECLGITNLSISACSMFNDETLCKENISYLLAPTDVEGTLRYGPEDYYRVVRDPLPYINVLKTFCCYLQPASNYLFFFGYMAQPYKRDRMFFQGLILMALFEMLLYYNSGYSMIFSLEFVASILLVMGMEWYIQTHWSVKKYAKYRLQYRVALTMSFFLCCFCIRSWVVKHYGTHESIGLPIVTLSFAPLTQRWLAQNLPLLIATTKEPATFKWLPYLSICVFILSLATAFSIGSMNALTIFQLLPYYMSMYFCVFSVATLVRYLELPKQILEPIIPEGKRMPGWYW
eukprot:g2111.t1